MKKATREQSKWHNNRLVLHTIYENAQISRADIARKTDLSPAAISGLVDELIQAGWIRENGIGPSSGGKRPTLITFNENSRVIIALELSDEYFHGAITDLRGKVISRTSVAVEDRRGQEVIDLVILLISQLISFARQPILGIGIGCQGVIDHNTGTVLQAVRLDWHDVPLKELLQAQFNLPVIVYNDSRAAALAQYAFGKLRTSNLILIKVGVSVSMGIMLNGAIHIGDGFGAGEIGHITVNPGGEECYCGHYGCLATVATTRSLEKEARRIIEHHPKSILAQIARNPENTKMDDIAAAFQDGDTYVVEAVRKLGSYLGFVLASGVCLLNVQQIFIAGGLSVFGESLLTTIRQRLAECCLNSLASQTRIDYCDLGDDVTMLGGAAALLRDQIGVV